MQLSARNSLSLGAAILLSAAQAQEVIDTLSFGHKTDSISVNHRSVDNWILSGLQHTPDLLSDRVILTPPYPGSKRGAIWTAASVPNNEWSLDMYFRASGPERGGGNLQVWYAKSGNTQVGSNSLYTIDKFDGLMIEIDQYGGRGGSIRGFLNDGTKSFKGQNVDQLSFGQCDYSYRNLGRFSNLGIKHTTGGLTVTVDGKDCFRSNDVALPALYEFGITAASAESPDSFEVSSFVTRTHNPNEHQDYYQQQQAYAREQQENAQMQQRANAERQTRQEKQGQQNQQAQQYTQQNSPDAMPDVLASTLRDQQLQFEDLHNRLQGVQHQLNTIFEQMGQLRGEQQEQHKTVMERLRPMHERLNDAHNARPGMQSTIDTIKKDIEGRDYSQLLKNLENSVQFSHSNVMETLPKTMDTLVKGHRLSLTTIILVFVAVQAVLVGGYMAYKRRVKNGPKKYL